MGVGVLERVGLLEMQVVMVADTLSVAVVGVLEVRGAMDQLASEALESSGSMVTGIAVAVEDLCSM